MVKGVWLLPYGSVLLGVQSGSVTFLTFVPRVWSENECADARGSGADGGGGTGARERDGRATARQDCGEDVWSVHEKCMYCILYILIH